MEALGEPFAGTPDDPDTLLREADIARYTAKKSGKGTCAYYPT